MKRILIMGMGNLIMGDEGVGVHFTKKLSSDHLPKNIKIVDGGTGGFHLMPYFENFKIIILVDATLDGEKAGTIRLIKPRFPKDFPRSLSSHDIGLKDLIEGLQLLGNLPEIYLFTVSIEKIQSMSIGLSHEIETCLETLKTKVLDLANELLQV